MKMVKDKEHNRQARKEGIMKTLATFAIIAATFFAQNEAVAEINCDAENIQNLDQLEKDVCEFKTTQVISAKDGTKFSVVQFNNVRKKQKEELEVYKKVQREEPLTVEEQRIMLERRGRRELLYVGINSLLGHGSSILGFLRYIGLDIESDGINELPFGDAEKINNDYYAGLYKHQPVPQAKGIFHSIKGDLYSFVEQLLPLGVADFSGDEKNIEYLGEHSEDMLCNEDYIESLVVTVVGMEKDSYGNVANTVGYRNAKGDCYQIVREKSGTDKNGYATYSYKHLKTGTTSADACADQNGSTLDLELGSSRFEQELGEVLQACQKMTRNVLKRYKVTHSMDQENLALSYLGAERGATNPVLNQDITPATVRYTDDFQAVVTSDLPKVKTFANIALLDYEYLYCKVLADMNGDYDENGIHNSTGESLCKYGVDSYGEPYARPSDINDSYMLRNVLAYFDIDGVAEFGNEISDVGMGEDLSSSDLAAAFGFDFTEDFFFRMADDLTIDDKERIASTVNTAISGQDIMGDDLHDDIYVRIGASPEGRKTFSIAHNRDYESIIYDDVFALGIDDMEANFPPYKARENDLFVLDFPINELDSAFQLSVVNGGGIASWRDDDGDGNYTAAEKVVEADLSSLDLRLLTNHDDLQALPSEKRVGLGKYADEAQGEKSVRAEGIYLSTMSGQGMIRRLPSEVRTELNNSSGLPITNAYGTVGFSNTGPLLLWLDAAECGGSGIYTTNADTNGAPSPFNVSYDIRMHYEDADGNPGSGDVVATSDYFGANAKEYDPVAGTGTIDPVDDQCYSGYAAPFGQDIATQIESAMAP